MLHQIVARIDLEEAAASGSAAELSTSIRAARIAGVRLDEAALRAIAAARRRVSPQRSERSKAELVDNEAAAAGAAIACVARSASCPLALNLTVAVVFTRALAFIPG